MVMFRCLSCNEIFLSVEVLRRNTSNRPVIAKFETVNYCPFCGGKVEKNNYEKRTKENR